MKKFEHFKSNLKVLVTAENEDLSNEFIVGGIIDKFFVQFELGWKVLKELLSYEGQSISATGSPKMILKTAYTIFDFIDEDIWLGMLKSRNDLTHIYDESSARRLADVYHSDNIDRVSDDFIVESGMKEGNFDNVKACGYAIPSHWDIGKVYKRLIKGVADREKTGVIDALFHVYNSFVSAKIDDYNSSMYYENPSYLLECYLENRVIE